MMNIFVTRATTVRKRSKNGVDDGRCLLNPGKYLANKTDDGALEILLDVGESVYLLPFIWWEKMELGDILIAS